MAVTWHDVQITLGRTLTTPQQQQAEAWIVQARIIIATAAALRATTIDALDQGTLDMVVTEAVASRLKRPDDATQVSVSVDDAQVSRRYESSTGQIEITGAWWDLLFPSTSGRAFTIGTHMTPDRCPRDRRHDW